MMRFDVDADQDQCLCCGSHVTPQFRRGFYDEKDRAHRCTTCDTYDRLSDGSAAGLDIGSPDPLEDPTRFQSAFEDLPENVKAACQPVTAGEIEAESMR
ncbi:DUF7563 family protein [Natrinema amylolyticum]|uniref:DUF7563 family protein n=1 Tax=Natrinema amylolyticum TaxID=2878679 RepID=UPI001CF9D313|nr:hypothetical protein [Natrinema amylolyticum]